MAYKVGRCLLHDLLKQKDMTQLELAERMGVKVQQVNKYYRDRQKMSLQVAKTIATILGCRIDDLYEWVEAGDEE